MLAFSRPTASTVLQRAVSAFSREDGHIGNGLAILCGLGAAIAIVLAFSEDSDTAGIIGGVLTGLGIIIGVAAPHEWVKRIYPRLDKLDPTDPEAHPEKRFRIEL